MELQKSFELVFRQGRHIAYPRTTVIIRAGDVPSGVYCIKSGYVRVFALNSDGAEAVCAMLSPGSLFSLEWALNDYMHEVSYVAHEDTEVWRLSRDDFQSAVRSEPAFSYAVAQSLATQLADISDEFTQLSYRSAYEKVVYRLLVLAQKCGRRKVQQIIIQVRVSHDYVAHSTGISRETASRVLSQLTRQRLIRRMEGRIVIPDIDRLSKIIQSEKIIVADVPPRRLEMIA